MAALVMAKVSDLFPGTDVTGCVIIAGGFAAVISLAIGLGPLVARLPLPWLNANEKRRQYAVIIAIGLIVVLIFSLLWVLLGPSIAPHFGQVTR